MNELTTVRKSPLESTHFLGAFVTGIKDVTGRYAKVMAKIFHKANWQIVVTNAHGNNDITHFATLK